MPQLPSLSALTAELDGAGDAEAVAHVLADVVTPLLCDWCLVDLCEPPDLVTRVAVRPSMLREAVADQAEITPLRRSAAARTGLLAQLSAAAHQSIRLSADQLGQLARSGDDRSRLQAQLALSQRAADLLILGLRARGELLGVLTVCRTDRGFSAEELSSLHDLAALAGVALDVVRLRRLQTDMAAALQASLLPPLPSAAGLTFASRYQPAVSGLDVGGDWFDVFPLPGGGWSLVVGDATGHDLRAATRMAELRSLLRATFSREPHSPAAALGELDRLAERIAPDLSATCLAARLAPAGPDAWRLTWSSAGHLPPMLLRGGSATVLPSSSDLMLGVASAHARSNHEVLLGRGSTVVFYTDGLVETRAASLDDGIARLREALAAAADLTLEALAERLIAELGHGGDDIAVLLFRTDESPVAD